MTHTVGVLCHQVFHGSMTLDASNIVDDTHM
jgi:hypothetical protein